MDHTPKPRRALAPGSLSLTLADYHVSDTTDSEDAAVRDIRPSDSPASALPTEVIQQILRLVDPETFASLVLLNRAWRKAADDPHIYAHHLAKCPSIAAANPSELTAPFAEEHLPKFKRYLVQEAKRSLFAAVLRPQQTIINLISTTTSSSAAFPNGEGYEFIFSHGARFCLALSSSRIIVIDTASPVVTVKRELKVVRRPVSAWILEDGSMLAVLAANHRVNIYDLEAEKAEFRRSIELDETAHTITMTTHGEILASGCEGGVEVVSLAEHGPQAAKRVIKCDRIDNLAFSEDGTMLLGTTQNSRSPSTVILTAPYFTDFSEHEMSHTELLSHLWTSQIIFPNGSRDCSHAALLPRKHDQDAHWALAYDRVFESFRAVRSDDLRNGTTYFTGPEPRQQRTRHRSKSSLTPKTLPAITSQGDLVAAAFLSSEIWLYGVPEDLERSGMSHTHSNGRFSSHAPSPAASTASSPRSSRRDLERLPRWQVLVDKYRNAFAKGRKVATVSGASNMCWYVPDESGNNAVIKERLIVTAPGGVSDRSELDLDQEDYTCVDGGRLVVLDFAWSSRSGKKKEITMEVGEIEPQLLEEEDMDMETEIAVVRRRTLARREGVNRSTVSSVAGVLRPAALNDAPPMPPAPVGFGLDSISGDGAENNADSATGGAEDHGVSLEEAIAGLDAPYSQTDPRSRGTVYRSAEAVEANRRRNPPHPASNQPVQYRRTDGTELPHESDADNWTPPPPAYGKHVEDDTLPDEMRRLMMPMDYQTPTDSSAPSAGRQSSSRPIHATNTPLRHSTVAAEAHRIVESRRRSSADVEGSRWFSRHQENRSMSPALNDEAVQIRGYTPSPSSQVDGRGSSPTHRPLSAYETRSSTYRAALQPAASIPAIVEPEPRSPSPAISARSGRSARASREFLAAAMSAASSSEPVAHLDTTSDLPVARPVSSRALGLSEHLHPDSPTQLRRNRTTPASATRRPNQVSVPRRPVQQQQSEPSAYQLNQLALASQSNEQPFGVGTEISSTSPLPQRRLLPRIKSFNKLTAALSSQDRANTAPALPTSTFSSTSSDNGASESVSRRSKRKSRRERSDSNALLSRPLEQAPLQQPLEITQGPLSRLSAAVAGGSGRSVSPGPAIPRPSSRFSQRVFRRARPQTEDPAVLASAVRASAVVETPRMRENRTRVPSRNAQTQSMVDVPEHRKTAWELSPFRGGGRDGEGEVADDIGPIQEEGDRQAIEGALRGAYGRFDSQPVHAEHRQRRPRAKTEGESGRKGGKCAVM